MKLVLIVFLCGRLALAAQTPQAAVRIGAPNAGSRSGQARGAVGAAVLGFLPGPGPLELSAILGVFGAARLSDPIAAPKTAVRLYVATGQQYVLVEQNSDAPLSVWDLAANSALTAIAGALPHPDLVAFSPGGDSAALYARESGQIQIIGGMPNRPEVHKTLPPLSPAATGMIAVSDDANVVVLRDPTTGDVLISNDGKSWQPF